jgi:hypothetical protein
MVRTHVILALPNATHAGDLNEIAGWLAKNEPDNRVSFTEPGQPKGISSPAHITLDVPVGEDEALNWAQEAVSRARSALGIEAFPWSEVFVIPYHMRK